MTRDEFTTTWLDEMTGVLLLAFHAEHESIRPMLSDTEMAKTGRFFLHQQRRARSMLGRMWDSMQPAKPVTARAAANGAAK